MIISFIAALSEDNAIGKENQLPWRLPNDLKFFKKTTMGLPVLMGRKTYESLGKPLPGRLNIVVSTGEPMVAPDVLVVNSLAKGLERMQQEALDEGFVIGGGEIFRLALPQAQRLYLTRVKTTVPDANAFFPEVDFSEWKLDWEEEHELDEQHNFDYTFQIWERK